MVVQDFPSPSLQRVTERADLFDVIGATANDGLLEHGGFLRIVGEIDVSDRFFGQPHAEQFVVGIAQAQPEQESVVSSLVEPLGALQEELADPVERIVFATTESRMSLYEEGAGCQG